MRLLHTETLRIVALVCKDLDFEKATVSRKQVISHAWSECLKYLATRQNHPKTWLTDGKLGVYLRVVKTYGDIIGCQLNEQHLQKYEDVWNGYTDARNLQSALNIIDINKGGRYDFKFDDNYLFSDCTTMYFKGLNIFQYVYGDDWRRLVPIQSLDEIYRVVGKAIEKRKIK